MVVSEKSGNNSSGFTLIEILVVLVLMGLLAALAVFTMGGNSQQRELQNEVRELYLLMQTASDQAVVNNLELGLLLEENGYRFVAFQEETGDWKGSGEQLFRARSFPEWLVTTPFIESDAPRLASAEDKLRPDVVFFSSGETTPFELEFTIGSDTDYTQILASDGISPIEWRQPGDVGENR
ncbi:type II secretion system minor pseudopilin GspH [Marinobacter sp. 1_MG-2023]|uniref:type II secretion system minor pseudopilin GspH n=1 Tax=Marinobacter sp. 1_MG-2023 TaxID=3062627 RepID=UPI0026E247FB|nr:type II secretion system minor pseudopilin GspH [Marinobacter sp. 1_MG-2023]MDO6824976.1 type II secretion system minor pseudopilin GspH [Marinobacter sp. 1_MG-2023]